MPGWDGKIWDCRWVNRQGNPDKVGEVGPVRSWIVGKQFAMSAEEGLFAATPEPLRCLRRPRRPRPPRREAVGGKTAGEYDACEEEKLID